MPLNFSNKDLWNALRKKFKSFESITSEATADTFTEKGWGEISRSNIPALNAFFDLSMRVAFNKFDIARVNVRLEESGLVENFAGQNGGYLQRISVESIAPISPRYLNLTDGSSVDPYIVRKPKSQERFFECGNFNYQSLITLQEFQVKTIFLAESGMSAFIAGIMQGLENGYKMQKELNIYKAIHECINNASNQSTQKIVLDTWNSGDDGQPTEYELKQFVAQLQDLATVMETSITQPGFNANNFDTATRPEDYVVLVRAGIMNKIKRDLMVGAFNPEDLAIPFSKIVEVQDFGGIQYYAYVSGADTRVYPVYDTFGAVKKGAWTVNSDGSPDQNNIQDGNVRVVDSDAGVLAVVAQKGVIFTETKEAYVVRPINNPAGLYDNYWASAPNNTIKYDKNYNIITIRKPIITSYEDTEITLTVGDTHDLWIQTDPQNSPLTYFSNNTAVATVSESGTVTAVSAGTADVRAMAQDGSMVWFRITVESA